MTSNRQEPRTPYCVLPESFYLKSDYGWTCGAFAFESAAECISQVRATHPDSKCVFVKEMRQVLVYDDRDDERLIAVIDML